VTTCDRCGFSIPEDAVFCPNCGAPVRKVVGKEKIREDIWRNIRLGLLGTFLALIINSMIYTAAEGLNLYFMPHFLSALIVICASRTKNIKDAMIISMLIYMLTEAILTGLLLGTLYMNGEKLASYYSIYYKDAPTLADVIFYSISPISSILAGFIGFKIAPKRREEYYESSRASAFGPALLHSTKGKLKKLKYIFLGFFIESK